MDLWGNNFNFSSIKYIHASSLVLLLYIGATAISFAFFGQGSGPILLDNVACTNRERRLIDCPANPIGEHNCNHFEDASVRCLEPEVTTAPCKYSL